MLDCPPPESLPLKVAVTATQTGFATTDDGGVISVLYDDFALIWPESYASSEPLRNARSISLLGHPGTALSVNLRGGILPQGARGISVTVQVMHEGAVESSNVLASDSILHHTETSFGPSGRITISVSAIIHPQPRGVPERQLHIDSLDIAVVRPRAG